MENWKVIKTEQEYNTAVNRMDEIFHAHKETPEGDELELLLLLIGHYEDEHYPIGDPDPIEAIKFRMEQMGIGRKELSEITGQHLSKISDYLTGVRPLSRGIMISLHRELSIPAEVLLK